MKIISTQALSKLFNGFIDLWTQKRRYGFVFAACLSLCVGTALDTASAQTQEFRYVEVHPINNWSVELDPQIVNPGAVCSLTRNFFKGYQIHITRDESDIITFILIPHIKVHEWYGRTTGVQLIHKDQGTAEAFIPRTSRPRPANIIDPSERAFRWQNALDPRDDGKVRREELKAMKREQIQVQQDKDIKQEQGDDVKYLPGLEYVLERHVSFFDPYLDAPIIRVQLEKLGYDIELQDLESAMKLLEGCTITKTGRVSQFEEEKLEKEVRQFYQDNPLRLTEVLRAGSDAPLLSPSQPRSRPVKKDESDNDNVVIKSLTRKITILEREKQALKKRLGELEDSDINRIRNNTTFQKEKEIYEKQISYLNRQIDSLLKENSKIRQSKVQFKTIPVPLASDEVDALRLENKQTEEKLASLQDQNLKLRKEIDHLKKTSKSKPKLSDAEQKKIQTLEQELELLGQLNTQLQAKNEELEALIDSAPGQTLSDTNGDILALTENNQSLYEGAEITETMPDIQSDNKTVSEQIEKMNDALSQENEALQKQNTVLTTDAQALKQQNQSLRSENQQLLSDVERLTQSYRTLEAQISDQQTTQQDITAFMDPAQDYKAENSRLEQSVANLEQNNQNLQQVVAEQKQQVTIKKAEVQEKDQKIQFLNSENRALQERIAVMEQAPEPQETVTVSEGSEDARALRGRVNALIQQNKSLSRELDKLRRAAKNTAISAQPAQPDQTAKLQSLVAEIDQLKTRNQYLQNQLQESEVQIEVENQDSQLAGRIQSLNTQNASLVNEINRLKSQIVSLEKQNTKPVTSIAPQQLAERDEIISRQQKSLEALRLENRELQSQISAHQTNINTARQNEAQACPMASNVQQMNNRIAALTHQNRVLSQQLKQSQTGGASQSQQPLSIIKVMPQLDPDYQEGATDSVSMANEMNVLKRDNGALKVELSKLRAQLERVGVDAMSSQSEGAMICGDNRQQDVGEKIFLLQQENDRLRQQLGLQ